MTVDPTGSDRGDIKRPTPEVEHSPEVQRAIDRMRSEGWTASPLVFHGDEVRGDLSAYEAARFLGMEDRVPRRSLADVFSEAGVDFEQVSSRLGSGAGSSDRRGMFEDYLRELPRHVRDKYGI